MSFPILPAWMICQRWLPFIVEDANGGNLELHTFYSMLCFDMLRVRWLVETKRKENIGHHFKTQLQIIKTSMDCLQSYIYSYLQVPVSRRTSLTYPVYCWMQHIPITYNLVMRSYRYERYWELHYLCEIGTVYVPLKILQSLLLMLSLSKATTSLIQLGRCGCLAPIFMICLTSCRAPTSINLTITWVQYFDLRGIVVLSKV